MWQRSISEVAGLSTDGPGARRRARAWRSAVRRSAARRAWTHRGTHPRRDRRRHAQPIEAELAWPGARRSPRPPTAALRPGSTDAIHVHSIRESPSRAPPEDSRARPRAVIESFRAYACVSAVNRPRTSARTRARLEIGAVAAPRPFDPVLAQEFREIRGVRRCSGTSSSGRAN